MSFASAEDLKFVNNTEKCAFSAPLPINVSCTSYLNVDISF